jgi:plexin A
MLCLLARLSNVLTIIFFLAFAELQTDMTDLTADLESSGIPTLDHKNYIMKVFFPGVSDHPILNDPKVRR